MEPQEKLNVGVHTIFPVVILRASALGLFRMQLSLIVKDRDNALSPLSANYSPISETIRLPCSIYKGQVLIERSSLCLICCPLSNRDKTPTTGELYALSKEKKETGGVHADRWLASALSNVRGTIYALFSHPIPQRFQRFPRYRRLCGVDNRLYGVEGPFVTTTHIARADFQS